MNMDPSRRATSAGYRLPERKTVGRPKSPQPAQAADRTVRAEAAHTKTPEQPPDQRDPVKQERVWKELVRSERRGVKDWEKNWGFLKDYDQMGQPKPPKPSPTNTSIYSDHVPNTSNQTFGSRLSTPLGSELVRMDRMLSWNQDHRRRKLDPEMLPF